jgi:hypothetical protein
MSPSPIEVVGQWLENLLDPEVVNRLVAPDALYASLNTENPELHKIMPVGRHIARPAGVPRQPRHDVYPVGEPGVRRDGNVRL